MNNKKVAFTKAPEASQNYDQQLPGSLSFYVEEKKRTTRRNLLGVSAPPEPCALDLPPSGRRFEKIDEQEKCWNGEFMICFLDVYYIVLFIYLYIIRTYVCVCVCVSIVCRFRISCPVVETEKEFSS